MNEQQFERWEARIRDTARDLPYPPTPDFSIMASSPAIATARPASRHRQGMVLAAVLLLLGVLAVPPVRARIIEVLRIGAIRILPAEPTIVPPGATPSTVPSSSTASTPRPMPTLTSSLLNLEGATTLQDAQQRVSFPIRLPTTPPELGPPDKVFLQDLGGAMLILVWLEPERNDQVQLSLHQFGPGTFAEKIAPRVVRKTIVRGMPAVWAVGPHLLRVRGTEGEDFKERRLVNGHVLIWAEGDVTYRLETTLAMEEAIAIAESLR